MGGAVFPSAAGWLADRADCQSAGAVSGAASSYCQKAQFHGNYCRCDPVDCVDLLFDSDMDGRAGSFSAGTSAGILSVAVS